MKNLSLGDVILLLFTNPVSMPLDEVFVLEGSLEGLCLFVVHLRVKSQFPVKLNLRLGI